MASDDAPEACMPCRGTGRVISNLGGTPQPVTCPWCRGSGARQAGIDTQTTEARREGDGGGEEPPDAAA